MRCTGRLPTARRSRSAVLGAERGRPAAERAPRPSVGGPLPETLRTACRRSTPSACRPTSRRARDDGGTSPFPIQALTIPDALAGRDVCGKAKTGSGKTLAFGLPDARSAVKTAEPRRPRALVLVPTRELATQVKRRARARSARPAASRSSAIYGGADMEKQIKALQTRRRHRRRPRPGRMIDLIDRKELDLADVAGRRLDEADRMADMGFLPAGRVDPAPHPRRATRRCCSRPRSTAWSTALIDRYQTDPVTPRGRVRRASPSSQMQHRFLRVHEMDKVKVAAAISARHRAAPSCSPAPSAAPTARRRSSTREGVKAAAIHGDLRQSQREKALADFTDGKLAVLVATDVAARGIHVDDVDVVIHFDPPDDHKAYLHRSGRTARAGESGVVVTLVLWNQELEVKRLLKRARRSTSPSSRSSRTTSASPTSPPGIPGDEAVA